MKNTWSKNVYKQFIPIHHKNSNRLTPKEEKSGLTIIHIYKQPRLKYSKCYPNLRILRINKLSA